MNAPSDHRTSKTTRTSGIPGQAQDDGSGRTTRTARTTRPTRARRTGTLLATLLALMLIVSQMPVSYAVDATSPTGINNTTARTLTIIAKDDVKQGTYEEDFTQDTTADALATSTSSHNFKISKLEPALAGSNIIPADKTTYKASTTQFAYVQTDNGQVKLTLPGPKAFDSTPGTEIALTTGKASLDGTAYATGNAPLQALVDTTGENYADGVYLIEEVGGANNPGWSVVVQIPTVTATDANSIATDVNYDLYVYPKVQPNLKPVFSSYVNVLDKPASTAFATPTSKLTDDSADWEHDGVTKGEYNTYTASFVLNGYDSDYGPRLNLGFGFFDEQTATISNILLQGSSNTSLGYALPALTVTTDTNKTMTVADNVEVGVIISNTGSLSTSGGAGADARYIGLQNATVSGGGSAVPLTFLGGLSSGYYSQARVAASARVFSTTPHIVFTNDGGSTFKVPATPNATASLVELIAHAIEPTITANGSLPTQFATLDLSAYNTNGYTTAAEIFGTSSNIKVELVVSIRASLAGSNFRAGDSTNDTPNATYEGFKPFLYGTTMGGGSAPLDGDINSFGEPVAVSGNLLTAPSDFTGRKLVDKYAEVETGAVNAIKVDASGKPLAGAIFALKNNDTGFYAAQWTDAAGPTFSTTVTAPNSTYTNVYTVTSDANGKVTYDGVKPGSSYELTEVAAPTGYKMLDGSAMPSISSVPMTWADNLTAAALAQTDPGYENLTKVINASELSLPNTGGPGMWLLVAASVTLIATGVMLRRRLRHPASARQYRPMD